MSYAGKNYSTDGGDKWVVGGTIELADGAAVAGRTAENQADSTATTVAGLVTDFNGLLSKLKAAGLMEADS